MTQVSKEYRNKDILADYDDGKGMAVRELASAYGLSDKQIKNILKAQGVDSIPRQPKVREQSISSVHARLGLHLYDYRFEKGHSDYYAANQINLSTLKLRRIERGRQEVDLLTLQDIAAYTETPLDDLVRKIYANG